MILGDASKSNALVRGNPVSEEEIVGLSESDFRRGRRIGPTR